MSVNNLGQVTANFKTWDHVGNVIPDIEHCEGDRPHLGDGGKVASWLPVQFRDKYYENWFVIMPGKAVALDPDGCLMPAEYGLTGATVTYTADDVTAGTIDVATGLAVTAAKTVTLSLLNGTRHASWTAATAGVTTITSGFMGRYGVSFDDSSKKYPIGVAPYAYIQWAGGDGSNPAEQNHLNYNMQHRVAVLCNAAIKLPLVPGQASNETLDTSFTASALTFGTRAMHNRTWAAANATGRYNATTGTYPVLSTYPVIALCLDHQDVAENTTRTTITVSSSNANDDMSGLLVNEKSGLSGITQAGDYWVDYPVGVIFVYSADGNSVPSQISGAAGTPRITYYYNGTTPGTNSKFASVLANSIKPGDFLKVGTESNLVIADPSSDNFADIIGQVICLKTYPTGGLDRVRTAYSPALSTDASGAMANGSASSASTNAGQLDQMAGSATSGYPANIHYAGAANTEVIINLVSR